jgi:hypothetical protein
MGSVFIVRVGCFSLVRLMDISGSTLCDINLSTSKKFNIIFGPLFLAFILRKSLVILQQFCWVSGVSRVTNYFPA